MDIVQKGLANRYKKEKRFRLYGLSAIVFSLICLSLLFISIFFNGITAFQQTFVQIDVFIDSQFIDGRETPAHCHL